MALIGFGRFCVRCYECMSYTYTDVGLSTLLVSTGRAMRRPLHCGTSDSTGSTFFLCTIKKMPFGCQMAKGLQHLCLKMCIWHLSLTSCRFSKRGEGIGNIVSILNFSVFLWLYIPKPNVGAGIYQNGVM